MNRATAITASPIGTLMNKIQRHDSSSVSTPPANTPVAPPAPATAPHSPNARVRALGSRNVVVKIVKVAGESTAPPSPCAARAAISSPPV